MTDINRLGLGTMGMNLGNKERAIQTIHTALNVGVSLSQLMIAWSLAKYDHMQTLVGTTKPEHLLSAADALKISLSDEDIVRIEAACPEGLFAGRGMRNFVFTDGRMMPTH